MVTSKSAGQKPALPQTAAPGKTVMPFDDKRGGLTARMAAKFGIQADIFLDTLKQTAFRQRAKKNQDGGYSAPVPVTNEQMAMMLHIAEKYDLDPFVKQLYAFATDGGIAPIVPIDGWLAIINRHPQFESMEIETAPPGTDKDEYWCACTITRKDRKKPVRIEEWLKECYRNTDPWNDMPKRMLRWKAIIQCGRVAFGLSGIFDPDEEERAFANAIDVTPPKAELRPPESKSAAEKTPPPAKPATPAVTLDQANVIADKLKEEGVALSLFLAKWEINAVEELPAACYDAALKSIDDASAGA